MKKLPLLILSTLLYSIAFASGINEGDTKTTGKDPKAAKKTVLIVGLKEGNITSNYYMTESIAEKTAISQDSLEEVFSREISESISRISDSDFNFVRLGKENSSKKLLDKVQYRYDKEMMVSDLTEMKDEDYMQLLKEYNADYVLFLDHYYLKYEGGSNLFHMFNYHIYNKHKKGIISGKSFFNTPELLPLARYEKKFEKTGNKIIDQLNKINE